MGLSGAGVVFDRRTASIIARTIRDNGAVVNRRPRRTYAFGGGGGGGNPFGYCVVRSYTDLSPWTLQVQRVVPIDRALGTWDVVGDIFTAFTHVIRSRYYQPFVWNGNVATIHEGHILPTFNEGGNIVVFQHAKMALVAQPTIRPITDCQVF